MHVDGYGFDSGINSLANPWLAERGEGETLEVAVVRESSNMAVYCGGQLSKVRIAARL